MSETARRATTDFQRFGRRQDLNDPKYRQQIAFAVPDDRVEPAPTGLPKRIDARAEVRSLTMIAAAALRRCDRFFGRDSINLAQIGQAVRIKENREHHPSHIGKVWHVADVRGQGDSQFVALQDPETGARSKWHHVGDLDVPLSTPAADAMASEKQEAASNELLDEASKKAAADGTPLRDAIRCVSLDRPDLVQTWLASPGQEHLDRVGESTNALIDSAKMIAEERGGRFSDALILASKLDPKAAAKYRDSFSEDSGQQVLSLSSRPSGLSGAEQLRARAEQIAAERNISFRNAVVLASGEMPEVAAQYRNRANGSE